MADLNSAMSSSVMVPEAPPPLNFKTRNPRETTPQRKPLLNQPPKMNQKREITPQRKRGNFNQTPNRGRKRKNSRNFNPNQDNQMFGNFPSNFQFQTQKPRYKHQKYNHFQKFRGGGYRSVNRFPFTPSSLPLNSIPEVQSPINNESHFTAQSFHDNPTIEDNAALVSTPIAANIHSPGFSLSTQAYQHNASSSNRFSENQKSLFYIPNASSILRGFDFNAPNDEFSIAALEHELSNCRNDQEVKRNLSSKLKEFQEKVNEKMRSIKQKLEASIIKNLTNEEKLKIQILIKECKKIEQKEKENMHVRQFLANMDKNLSIYKKQSIPSKDSQKD